MVRRGRRRGAASGACVALVLVLVGCSASDDAEVAGAVLERDADADPQEATGEDDDPAAVDRADEPAAEPPDDGQPPPVDDGDAGAPDADEPPGDGGTAGGSGVTAVPDGADDPPTVEPLVLADGPGAIGDVLGFSDEDVGIGGSGPIDVDDPQPLVAHVRKDPDEDRAWCVAVLAAPPDRGLVAVGELTVSLRLTDPAGAVRTVERARLQLDVSLDPGEVRVLPETPPLGFERDEVSELACIAVHGGG